MDLAALAGRKPPGRPTVATAPLLDVPATYAREVAALTRDIGRLSPHQVSVLSAPRRVLVRGKARARMKPTEAEVMSWLVVLACSAGCLVIRDVSFVFVGGMLWGAALMYLVPRLLAWDRDHGEG